MNVEGRDIICCSTHYWDERHFRKQEFMSRFARSNRVLYVEPSFSMVRQPEAHLRRVGRNRFLLPRLEPRSDRLSLLQPPRGLPRWSQPSVERINYQWYGRVIARATRRLGFRRPLLWIYRPSYVHALSAIEPDALVMDLVDDLPAYGGGHLEHVEAHLQELARLSDLLVVTAATLLERYGPLARQSVQISNGFDAALFSPSRDHAVPAPLANVPRPILGFVGTLFSFLDFDLLEAVAREESDKSMVLVGPIEASARASVERLVGLPNVVHIPGQPQSAMPSFISAFDVCLNPFRAGRVADSVSPVKVYEYLAMGKPVVSSPMKSLQLDGPGSVVSYAADAHSFAAKVNECLTVASRSRAHVRRAAVAQYSWDALFSRLDQATANALAK